MDTSTVMALASTWLLMAVWLVLVAIAGVSAFKKWGRLNGLARQQFFYLWLGPLFIFIGDLLHTIAYTISASSGSPTGVINVLGVAFELQTFAYFYDGLIFMIYYSLWALFIVARYQQGEFQRYDKITLGLALLAMLCILPGAVPNAFGLYTIDYDISLWSPHMLLFVIFGLMTVGKLIRCSRSARAQTPDPLHAVQERALNSIGICLVFSFLFFVLTLALIPVKPIFGLFMIPKTFAYMAAFVYIITGVIRPMPVPMEAGAGYKQRAPQAAA
jgi:hypothetical protein